MKLFQKIIQAINHKVLFCDLDGTLIVTKSGETFPKDINDWKMKDGIKEAILEYNPRYIYIVSNQGGIEKGFVDEVEFYHKMCHIREIIRSWGNFEVEFQYCKSNDPKCTDRKPNTGMLDFFYHGYVMGFDFDKRNAIMIGDASGLKGQFSDSDLQTAKNFGIKYCDVDAFIEAMVPCQICRKLDIVCGVGGAYPECELPCAGNSKGRLKKILLNK